MPARDDILRALRAARVPELPLPDVSAFSGIRYPDLRERFAKAVVEAGGRCAFVEGTLEEELAKVPEYASARKVVSLLPGVAKANVDLAAVADPHQLHDVDFCVVPADLGVAENGACWITSDGGRNRAAIYLAQHLAVVVREGTLVHNLHEAYRRLRIPSPGFGQFLSGPSKTADIEQALVIGAHGARSCMVLITA